jgi:hypothetical protein
MRHGSARFNFGSDTLAGSPQIRTGSALPVRVAPSRGEKVKYVRSPEQ